MPSSCRCKSAEQKKRRSTLERLRVYNSITTGARAVNIPFFQDQQSFKPFSHLMSNQFERFWHDRPKPSQISFCERP